MIGIYFSGTGNSRYAAEMFCNNQCTMCYRCINNCPKQAMTLLGKTVVEQSVIEKYI